MFENLLKISIRTIITDIRLFEQPFLPIGKNALEILQKQVNFFMLKQGNRRSKTESLNVWFIRRPKRRK